MMKGTGQLEWAWQQRFRVKHMLGQMLRLFRYQMAAARRYSIAIFLVLYAATIGPLAIKLYLETLNADTTNYKDALIALGTIVGVPFLGWRTLIAWKQASVAHQTHITELFTNSIEHLVAERETRPLADKLVNVPNVELRVGAIHSLGRIASGSPQDHWRVMEVLATYIRINAQSGASGMDRRTRYDVQAALDVVGRRLREGIKAEQKSKLRLDLSGTDLSGFEFSRWYNDEVGATETRFANIDFSDCNLSDADFTDAYLSNCKFNGARMQNTRFFSAELSDAEFDKCNLQNAVFSGANLRRSMFNECDMKGCGLSEADCRGSVFQHCNLSAADLNGANFVLGYLVRSNCENANFSNASMNGAHVFDNRLKGAKFYDVDLSGLDLTFGLGRLDLCESKGDASTILGMIVRPEHWPDRVLKYSERHTDLVS